jgi:putative membrane protein
VNPLLVAALVLAAVAALIHVAIFTFESVTWARPRTWRRFGVRSQEDADVVKPMAFNQGFYNLFLAIGAVVGIPLVLQEPLHQAGAAVLIVSLGSMLAAALVLVLSNPRLARAALTQGAAPLLSLALLIPALLP